MSRRARFGLFDFDPDTGVLNREGVPVRLQPQPGRVLAILVTHAGEVVTRDALRQEIWNDGTFVDFERGLNFCIAQIRSALGDLAESPRFIETLPRRGYRFIAPVLDIRPVGVGSPVGTSRPLPFLRDPVCIPQCSRGPTPARSRAATSRRARAAGAPLLC